MDETTDTPELDYLKLRSIKRYNLDIDKIMESDDVNKKLNILFIILNALKLSIDDCLMTDEIREYFKEI